MYKGLILILVLASGCTSQIKKGTIGEALYFDHTFTMTENEEDYFRFEKMGFFTRRKPVMHPGPLACRFLYFKPTDYPFRQYLEWCYTPDYKAMVALKESKGEVAESYHGLGFKTEGNIAQIFQFLENKFKDYGTFTFHKNFEWEKSSTEVLPGWDYIATKKPIINGINLFVVKYDKLPKKFLNVKPVEPNTNTTDKIIATIVDLNDEEYGRISDFSLVPFSKGSISNDKGFHIININSFKDFKDPLKQKKRAQKAVVLRFKDHKKFIELAKPDYKFKAYGQTFYGIKTPKDAWEIWATDSDAFVRENPNQ